MIRAGGERGGRDGWFAGLAFPDAGDAEEIGVKAGPEIVAEVQDEAAGREIVLRKAFTDIAGIQHAAEDRKILLHKVSPRRWTFGRGFLGEGGLQGNEKEEKRSEIHRSGYERHSKRHLPRSGKAFPQQMACGWFRACFKTPAYRSGEAK